VTWLREAQERLARAERLASVSTLVRGLAHEMNNPLASLMANLDYLGEELGAELAWRGQAGTDRTGELRQSLIDACESARRVGALVADLKTFTSIGEPPAHPPGPLRAAVEEALRLAQVQLEGSEVVVEVPDGLGVEVGHAELLQVVAALLMNAGQAGGGRPNRVRVRAEASGTGRVALRISDSGAGMDAATLAHAFEPFFTTRGVGGGRGLGLSVCLGIVEGAGGEIRLESQPGDGTVAHLDLPAALPGRPG
jgi:C4-dicarboxylate-specific signal transduction histidine kinase